MEDNFKHIERRGKINKQSVQGNRTPDFEVLVPRARLFVAKPKSRKKQTQQPHGGDYNYTEGSSGEKIAAVDHFVEDCFARSMQSIQGETKPLSPPAPRRTNAVVCTVALILKTSKCIGSFVKVFQRTNLVLQTKMLAAGTFALYVMVATFQQQPRACEPT